MASYELNSTNRILKKGGLDEIIAEIAPLDLWRYRATMMCQAVLPALILLRDNKRRKRRIVLNTETFHDHMKLENVIRLLDETAYPEIPAKIRQPIVEYLCSLPGFKNELGLEQSNSTHQHHGYLTLALSLKHP